jgi:ABC-2 type transport system permease protein
MGISWFRRGITDFFSGAIIPLSFFPAGLKTVSDILPFRGIVSVPATIFIGQMSESQILVTFAVEIAWIVGLWYIARLIWHFAMRKVTIHGG